MASPGPMNRWSQFAARTRISCSSCANSHEIDPSQRPVLRDQIAPEWDISFRRASPVSLDSWTQKPIQRLCHRNKKCKSILGSEGLR